MHGHTFAYWLFCFASFHYTLETRSSSFLSILKRLGRKIIIFISSLHLTFLKIDMMEIKQSPGTLGSFKMVDEEETRKKDWD